MKKESFYFPHYYNSRNDERVLMLRARFGAVIGFGLYFLIVEVMAESKDGSLDRGAMKELSMSCGVDEIVLKEFIDYAIAIGSFAIIANSNRMTARRIKEHKKFRSERSVSGQKGAKVRWKQSHSSAIGSANSSANAQLIALKGKERKGKNNMLSHIISKDASEEAKALFGTIGEMCNEYGVENSVSLNGLDVLVNRYVSKVRMKVEVQHALSWLLDFNEKLKLESPRAKPRTFSTGFIGNWFKRNLAQQKREQLRDMESKPQTRAQNVSPAESDASLQHFLSSQ